MYEVTAKAETESLRQTSVAIGTMLQTLLRDRFALQFHYEIRQLPVDNLTVASRGPKLRATVAGSCMVVRFWRFGGIPPKRDKPICGLVQGSLNTQLNHTGDLVGMSIAGAPDKLERTQGPVKVPVIDHAKPSL